MSKLHCACPGRYAVPFGHRNKNSFNKAFPIQGYYDGVIFHRVVPDFLVQTGDRTGTGGGGESFYGGVCARSWRVIHPQRPYMKSRLEPFEDEIHPRLRFAHRGLVGMANNGAKDSNDSQVRL